MSDERTETLSEYSHGGGGSGWKTLMSNNSLNPKEVLADTEAGMVLCTRLMPDPRKSWGPTYGLEHQINGGKLGLKVLWDSAGKG